MNAQENQTQEQMTLLDHFAGQIAASMVNAVMVATAGGDKRTVAEFGDAMIVIPVGAYKMAEALLAERAKRMNAQEDPQ